MTPSAPRPLLARLWPVALLVLLAALAYWAFHDRLTLDRLRESHAALEAARDEAYLVTALVFVAVYTGVVALSLPGATVTTLTGGFLFGVWPGTLFNMLGATFGATVLFLAIRFGFGRSLAARIDAISRHAHRERARLLTRLRAVQDAVDAFARGELDREQLDLVLGALESPEDGATD